MAVPGIIATPAKWWLYGAVGLAVIGAPTLAVTYSNAFATGVGTGTGIVVNDFPKLVESFQEQQQNGSPAPAPSPTTP